jgi:membrane-bound metal-dependent hydrolase YbcI (DUF457 family)
MTIALVLVAALLWRRRRDVLIGVALALALHFWRDLAESDSGVSLLWPFTDRAFTIPYELRRRHVVGHRNRLVQSSPRRAGLEQGHCHTRTQSTRS